MSATPQKAKKSLVKKLLKFGLLTLLLLLLLVAGTIVYAVLWISSDDVKTFDNVELFGGGSLSVGAITVSDIWDYPELDLIVRNLHVWENERTHVDSAYFVMNEGRIRFRADLLNSDTILLRQLTYDGGRLELIRDEEERNPAERIGKDMQQPESEPRFKFIISPDALLRVAQVDLHLANPNRDKDYKLFVNQMQVSELEIGENQKALVDFDVYSKGITFNSTEGAFATNTPLKGVLDFQHTGGKAIIGIPNLVAGTTAIDFSAVVFPKGDSISKFRFAAPQANVDLVLPMLSPSLQSKLVDFDVEGEFGAEVKLDRINEFGVKPIVHINFQLRGNQARVKQYTFENTYLDAKFINRLPSHHENFMPDTIGTTFIVDSVSATGFGFDFTSVKTKVASIRGQGATIIASAHGIGPAKALSELLKNDQYLFTKGKAELSAELNGPLYQITQLLDLSNCSIKLTNPSILFVDAEVLLPLKLVEIHKEGNQAEVLVTGVTGSEGHEFSLSGNVQGVSRLVGGEKPEPVVTQVTLESSHLTWKDLSAYLGTKADESTLAGQTFDKVVSDESKSKIKVDDSFDPASLKAVLTAIESSFHPNLDVEIDTVSYLEIDLVDFSSGVHFNGKDTLILERTTFILDTAKVGFGGSVCVGLSDQAAYEFFLKAKHVNVEKILAKINYLNSDLLAGLNTLPNDVDVEINQLGFIHNEDGILPNSSTGFIDLVSNKQQAFKAHVDFEPDRPDQPAFKSTRVKLEGNAVLFNDFFDTEDFLFQEGNFNFSMAYSGLVPDLKSLIQKEEMKLDFRNGRVLFRSAELEVPVNSLQLVMENDTADVQLFLRSEQLGQELMVTGIANNLSEVVIGKTGKQFSTVADVSSERIVWKDLNALIGTFAGERDTTVELNLRKTTKAIMSKFCPDVTLKIGELQLNDRLALKDLTSGLMLGDHKVLYVDTTGFTYGNGSMQLAGSVNLEDLTMTPFEMFLNTDDLDLASLLVGFDYFGIESLRETNILEGKLSLALDLEGDILEHGGRIPTETAKGVMSFSFYDLEVDGLQQIDDLAERFRMTDRLDDIKIAPISNIVTIDSNLVHFPLMEIPTSAFRVFLAGDMDIGRNSNFWLSVPLANLNTPDSSKALKSVGYAENPFKVHLEFVSNEKTEDLKTKLRWSRRRYYKQRDELEKWKADKKSWRAERKRARKAGKK